MAVYLMPVESGRPIVLDKAVIFIGRHPDCDIVVKHSRKVSRKHCCIAQVDSRLVIRDLGSMNGIRVNGKRVRKDLDLRLGDEVLIGDALYVVRDAPSNKDRPAALTDGKPAAAPRRPAPSKRSPPLPVDISQDYPVPLPEDDEIIDLENETQRDKTERDSSDWDEPIMLSD